MRHLILHRYKETSFTEKFFLWLRFAMTPYSKIISPIPNQGKVLDLGCGHGLLSFLVRAQKPACTVWGVDHDQARIETAQRAAIGDPNVRFQTGALIEFLKNHQDQVQSICLIDTIHYFDPEKQKTLLTLVFERLVSGGVFLMRDPNPNSRWNKFYEKLATGLGFTKTAESLCYFRSPSEWKTLLESIGFKVSYQNCSHPLFSDVLFIAIKTA